MFNAERLFVLSCFLVSAKLDTVRLRFSFLLFFAILLHKKQWNLVQDYFRRFINPVTIVWFDYLIKFNTVDFILSAN